MQNCLLATGSWLISSHEQTEESTPWLPSNFLKAWFTSNLCLVVAWSLSFQMFSWTWHHQVPQATQHIHTSPAKFLSICHTHIVRASIYWLIPQTPTMARDQRYEPGTQTPTPMGDRNPNPKTLPLPLRFSINKILEMGTRDVLNPRHSDKGGRCPKQHCNCYVKHPTQV